VPNERLHEEVLNEKVIYNRAQQFKITCSKFGFLQVWEIVSSLSSLLFMLKEGYYTTDASIATFKNEFFLMIWL